MFSQFKGREILGTPFIFNQKHLSVFVIMPVDEIPDINGVVWKHSATSKGCALSFVYRNVNQSSEVYVDDNKFVNPHSVGPRKDAKFDEVRNNALKYIAEFDKFVHNLFNLKLSLPSVHCTRF